MLKNSINDSIAKISIPNLIRNISPDFNKGESCPNCGNTSPIFQHFQNGMLVCFICRKASFNDKNFIASF